MNVNHAVKRSIMSRLCTEKEVARFYALYASDNGTEFGSDGQMTVTKSHYPSLVNKVYDQWLYQSYVFNNIVNVV